MTDDEVRRRLERIERVTDDNLLQVFTAAFLLVHDGKIGLEVVTRAADRLLEMAKNEMIDPLTGLWNRRYFNLQMAILREKYLRNDIEAVSIILFDLDGLKQINDDQNGGGHAAGDSAITGLANIVLGPHHIVTAEFDKKREERDGQILRETDIVCRLGGDEFAVILPNAPVQIAILIAERIRSNVDSQSGKKDGVHFTASLGVAGLKRLEPVEGLIKRADSALYEAKDSGKNCFRVAK